MRDQQWGLSMVRAPAAWPTSTGVGAVIAVIDTGVQGDHPDLGGRLRDGRDFVGDDPDNRGDDDSVPEDGDGHGTHVTGITVANRDNGEGIAGVAPGAQVVPLRVLDNEGGGFASDTIEAINWAVAKGVHVINLSLGDYVPLQSALVEDPDYAAALRNAVDRGVIVVLAAGNNGVPACENPKVEGTLCVGAVDRRGQRSAFSSFGQGVHLFAPGGSGARTSSEDVLSTYKNSRYASIAGTSQASPHVAGVAAMLVSLGVRGRAAVDRIISTAAASPAPGMGAGIVDAEAAVAGLAPPDPGDPGPPPPATGSFTTKRTVTVGGVRKHGFRVRCTAARAGRCAVVVRYRGRKIARGGGDVPAQLATRVAARLNVRGKRTVSRVRRRIRVKLTVTLPGEAARSRRITVRRRS